MKKQINGTYLLMDLEMTGLNPFRHGVVEFGCIIMDEKFSIIGEIYRDLCPPESVMIDREALEYNGFTLERIARGISYDAFVEEFETFLNFFFPTEPPIIVGQYVTADIVFLESIFFTVGRNDLMLKLGNDIIDTKSIANQENALARYKEIDIPYKSTSLSKPGGLSEVLSIAPYQAHSSKGDIYATREVLMKMLYIE
jgi:DNA polymerase III epsilon subunit-like protein